MTTLKTYFEQGLSAEEYKAGMQDNKENMEKIYDQFSLPEDPRLEIVRGKQLKVIVITEDWCGDAMMNIPVLLRIAERTDMDVKMVLRDENLELIDQYLTNGTARSIPIFVFLDEDYHQAAVWGPRAQVVQDFVTDVRSDLPAKDDPDFEEQSNAKHKIVHSKYLTAPEFWDAIYESIMERLIHA